MGTRGPWGPPHGTLTMRKGTQLPPAIIAPQSLIHWASMKTGLLLLLLSAFALAADPGEKAVRDSVTKFVDAAHSGDEATLKSLLGDGLIYTHSSAKRENKAECIAALVKGKPHFELKPGYIVQMYGNSAVVSGFMDAHNMADGKTTTTKLDYVMVWVKVGSGWQMVARHTAKLPA